MLFTFLIPIYANIISILQQSESHHNVKELQLQRKQLEELIQSLQMATVTAARKDDSHEQDLILKARLANISERLMRLEEQGWVNEPLPDYA